MPETIAHGSTDRDAKGEYTYGIKREHLGSQGFSRRHTSSFGDRAAFFRFRGSRPGSDRCAKHGSDRLQSQLRLG